MFHYALKPSGLLVLGKSESMGEFTYLFEPQTRRGMLFKKKFASPLVKLKPGYAIFRSIEKMGNPFEKSRP